MNRLQWFKISPLDRKASKILAGKLLALPYKKSTRMGFDIETVRDDFISGRFIERIEFSEVVEDPFGAKVEIKRIRFDTTEFSIYQNDGLIECYNAGKNLKGLLNEIAKLSNYDVSISKVQLSLSDFIECLKEGPKSLIVNKIVADDIDLGDGVSAQLLAGGLSDIRGPLKKFIAKRSYVLYRVRIVVDMADELFAFEITKAGTVSFASLASAKIRVFLRERIASVSKG